jgi:hypothetical protein
MNEKLKVILFLIGVSILFASGIMAIIIPCIINSNWYSLFSVFLFVLAMGFPVLCNAHKFDEPLFMDDNDSLELGGMLAWFLAGTCLTIAYSIPFLLWHKTVMDLVNMICTMSGGTVMIMALGLFGYFILLKKNDFDLFS